MMRYEMCSSRVPDFWLTSDSSPTPLCPSTPQPRSVPLEVWVPAPCWSLEPYKSIVPLADKSIISDPGIYTSFVASQGK